MIFSKRGTFYQVSRVTGTTHDSLAVDLAASPQKAHPAIKAVAGFCSGHGVLDPAAIASTVLQGLALANGTFNTMYAAAGIEYHAGDNPPEEIYGVLAFKIIEHLVSGGEFSEGESNNG